ncbi:reverse transcriptase domain-containing protein [Tanacetum coccineum]
MDHRTKPLPDNAKYVFLEEPSFLPVIISSQLSKEKKNKLVSILKKHKEAFTWKTTNIHGICLSFCKHKIQLLDEKKPIVQKQIRLNPNMQEVVKKEIMKLLDTCIIYPIADKFDIEIKDRKGTENVAADHLSRIENDKSSNDSEVDDNFPGETLMEINTKDEPCGQVENTNRALKRILEKTVKDNLAIWSRKLDDALWAFRTAYKIPTSTTPYKLIYGKNCHLPFEIEHRAYWALKNCNPDLIVVGEKRMFQLHELDELRHQAYENSRLYKARTKVWHDRKLRMRKEFKQGNKVLLFHSKYKFKQPKLRYRWLGPYVVKHQYPSGYVELYGKDGKTFIVNGHRLKLYHEEDNDPREAVTPFFPKE